MQAAPAGNNPALVHELIGSLAAPQTPTPTDFAAVLAERRSSGAGKQSQTPDERKDQAEATREEPARSDEAKPAPAPEPQAAAPVAKTEKEAPDPLKEIDPGETLERSHAQELTRDYSLAERAAQELSAPALPDAATEEVVAAAPQPVAARRTGPDAEAATVARPGGSAPAESEGKPGAPSTPSPPSAPAAQAAGAEARSTESRSRAGQSQTGAVGATRGATQAVGQGRTASAQTAQPVPGVSAGKGGTSAGAGQALVGAKEVLARIGGKSGQPQMMKSETATAAHAARVIVQGVREGRTDVVMRLRPESLGPVRIELSVQDERVTARIEAATPAAHELLTESIGHLRSALEARGLNVAGLDVVLAAEPREHSATLHADPDAERRGNSGGYSDPGQEDSGGRRRSDDGTTAEPWGAAGAAEPAGAWFSRGEDGLAVIRVDTTI